MRKAITTIVMVTAVTSGCNLQKETPTVNNTITKTVTKTPTSTPSSSKPTPKVTPSATKKVTGDPVKRTKKVYLTFDDGPSKYTPEVLSILKRYNAKATFFIVGSEVKGKENILKDLVTNGMSLQAHSWRHDDYAHYSYSYIDEDIKKTNSVIASASGVKPTIVRPPYGATNAKVKKAITANGMKQELWTVDTNDWQLPGSEKIWRRAIRVKPNGVILMHDGGGSREETVAALPDILKTLKEQGYTFDVIK